LELHQACLAEHILVAPGSVFGTAGRFPQGLRIGLGGDWGERHLPALRRVGELAQQAMGCEMKSS
jgi:DNA-binding transcriptional MocR family regulator